MENVSVLVAIGVRVDGRREAVGVAGGVKKDAGSWRSFVSPLVSRAWRPATGAPDSSRRWAGCCPGPVARGAWCIPWVGVLAGVGPGRTRWAADALEAVFAMESHDSALARAGRVATGMEEWKPGVYHRFVLCVVITGIGQSDCLI